MTQNIFEKREQAFEAVFFARLDAERIEQLRAQRQRVIAVDLLARSTGISNPELLERLLARGIDATNIQALFLVPLVATAWASGEVTRAQRDATLRAAESQGVSIESGAYHLLEAWLDVAPAPNLEKTWGEYMQALLEQLEPEAAVALKRDLHARCRQVARASGGFLGIGAISDAESKVMKRLEETLEL
jgi:hypothetical protein